ncbi:MAG: glutamine synthetase family protein [Pseudomonadota bacterium]
MPKSLTAGVVDLNGQIRGKRFPFGKRKTLETEGFRMPVSLMGVDIWGRDSEGNKLVFEKGDADGKVLVTDRGPVTTKLGNREETFLPCMLWTDDGEPFAADPRQTLAKVASELAARKLTPVVATELEFYLTDPKKIYATSQRSDRILDEYNMVCIRELERVGPFLDDVYSICEAQGIPADTAISENGEGQFEINLKHVPDAVRAADDAVLFKRAVKACAKHHKLTATFMAKPFADRSGNGLHVHFSMLREEGENIFDRETPRGLSNLEAAVAGCISAMPSCMAAFAPHQNSYRRFAAHSHAPCKIAWGFENRTTALRIPGGPAAASRVEHRVAGADANPYLVIAAILQSALDGLDRKMTPPPPVEGDAYNQDLPMLPTQWRDAVAEFEKAPFDPLLVHAFTKAKEQEMDRFLADISAFEYRSYIDHA